MLFEESISIGGASSASSSEEESDGSGRDLAGADFRRMVEVLGLDAGRGGLKGGAFRFDGGFALSIGIFVMDHGTIKIQGWVSRDTWLERPSRQEAC